MASSITLDVSGLTQQLVTAVTAGMAKVQQEMSKPASNATSAERNEKVGINGTREQIIANARVLYSAVFDINPDLVPAKNVVVKGADSYFSAVVLYPAKHSANCPSDHRRKMAVFYCTHNANTAEEALKNLLHLTSRNLEDNWDDTTTEEVGGDKFKSKEGFCFIV